MSEAKKKYYTGMEDCEYADMYIDELEKQNEELKKKVLNVEDACYCELCFGLEKQNEELMDFLTVIYESRSNMHEEIETLLIEKVENYYKKPIEEILKER